MTRQKTLKQYWIRGAQLMSRCSMELGLPGDGTASPDEVVSWLLRKKPSISKATYRHYKSALIFVLATLGSEEELRAARRLQCEPQTGALKKGRSTSSEKLKKLPPDDFEKLLTWLSRQRSSYAAPLGLFLAASILTGLRPEEWTRAQLRRAEKDDGRAEYYLLVENAKFDEERSLGRTRVLLLSNFYDEAIGYIRDFIKWRNRKLFARGVKWRSVQKSLARLLYQANRAVWPKRKRHYALYSCRHQASANFKGVYDPVYVAALLGHKSSETAGRHYGKVRSKSPFLYGTKPVCIPEPHSLDVRRVKKHRNDNVRPVERCTSSHKPKNRIG